MIGSQLECGHTEIGGKRVDQTGGAINSHAWIDVHQTECIELCWKKISDSDEACDEVHVQMIYRLERVKCVSKHELSIEMLTGKTAVVANS